MVSRKTLAILLVFTVILTGISTFTLGNVLMVGVGDKVLVDKQELQRYQELESEFGEVVALQGVVEQQFYKDTKDVDFKTGLKRSLFQSLNDPYSVYFDAKEFKSFNEMNEGSYGGIGVIVSPGDDGLITVVSPIADTPGERAGLATGDKILKVNGKDVFGDKIDEAVGMMKGQPGTGVILSILKKDNAQLEVKITREKIILKSAESEMLTDGVGYLKLNVFDEKSASEFEAQLKSLTNKKAKGLIIDLRNNPGGSLEECVKISDMLLGEQTIVSTKDRAGTEEVERSDAMKTALPYVLLVNGGSASASEILTGAVKDTKSGVVIGTRTFGKGLVQAVNDLPDGSGYKITVAQYFTPNGSYIHGKGIEPDIVVELPEALKDKTDMTHGEDPQFQKALEVIKTKMK